LNDPAISVLIPAAGASRRLGQTKQLVKFMGKSLLQSAIDHAISIEPLEIIVVTGAAANEIEADIAPVSDAHTKVRIVHNPLWMNGIGSSIAKGISALSNHAEGVLILLADQWRIEAVDLQNLARVWIQDSSRIVVSRDGDYQGPPVIFPRDCFSALGHLNDDQGAQAVIQANLERQFLLDISNASTDLDTPEDLTKLLASQVTD